MTTLNKKPVINEEAKETAKKIRQALKVNFPGVKFSVTTQVYTGGSSVNVSWTDLPLRDEVETVVNKFKSGSFNGMEDIYEHSAYEYEGKLYSGAKYLFCKRELSPEYKEQIKNYMKENYASIDENDYYYYSHFNQAEVKMIEEMKTPAQVEEVVTVENEITETVSTQETSANGEISFEVGTGAKGNGIEIMFTEKPSEEVRNEMKKAGYRWGGKSRASIWWAINNYETLSLAVKLAGEGVENDYNTTEEETLEVLETTSEAIEIPVVVEQKQPYNNTVNETPSGFYCYFKAWNLEAEQITNLLNKYEIPFEEFGEKFFFHGVNGDDYNLIKQINSENGSILHDNSHLHQEQPKEIVIETTETEQPQNFHNNKPAKVLDFTSKFKQKQEQRELEQAKDHFLSNVLPYMTKDDQFKLLEASGDSDKFNSIMSELMIKTAFLKASDDVQQYK